MNRIIFLLIIFAMTILTVSCTTVNISSEEDSTTAQTSETIVMNTDNSITDQMPENFLESTPYVETDAHQDEDFEPGVILLGLKEPYDGNIGELFPEINIEEVEDIYLTWYEQIKNSPDMEKQIEDAKNKIGTEFIVILTDTTKEAVLVGITLIENNPLVAYASPNFVVYPS